jgi:two-component system response regulator MprA
MWPANQPDWGGNSDLRERILVIDDDDKIISMLRRALAFEGYSVTTASNGQEGLRSILEQTPQLVILDVMMPYVDGWEVCRRIREGGGEMPIMMLTAKDEVADRVKGLDMGADDYLVKPFALEELLARVRVLLRRKSEIGDQQTNRLSYDDITMDFDTREVFRDGKLIELTTKEYDLLHLFLQNPKRVLSRDLIMEKIWGYDFSGESNVLEVYIALLRQKLEEHGGKRIIQTVRGAGYVLRGD